MGAIWDLSIMCDDCGNWEHGGGSQKINRARKFVRTNYKWHTVRRDKKLVDLCSQCYTAQYKKAA